MKNIWWFQQYVIHEALTHLLLHIGFVFRSISQKYFNSQLVFKFAISGMTENFVRAFSRKLKSSGALHHTSCCCLVEEIVAAEAAVLPGAERMLFRDWTYYLQQNHIVISSTWSLVHNSLWHWHYREAKWLKSSQACTATLPAWSVTGDTPRAFCVKCQWRQ